MTLLLAGAGLVEPAASSSLRILRSDGVRPAAFRQSAADALPAESFLAIHSATLGLGPDDTLHLLRQQVWADGRHTSWTYRQHHRGLPVVGAELVLVTTDEGVIGGLSHLEAGLDVDPTPGVDAAQALARALAALAARKPGSRLDPRHAPRSRLQIVPLHHRGRLVRRIAYRIELRSTGPEESLRLTVDAADGAVLDVSSTLDHAWVDVSASGPTVYDGDQTFFAQRDDATGDYRLVDQGDPFSVFTWDLEGTPLESDVISPVLPFPATLAPHVSVHWAAQEALRYFLTDHAHLGLDGGGFPLAVHIDPPIDLTLLGGAAWDRQELALLFPSDLAGNDDHPVSLDIVAHELTHGIQFFTVGAGGFDPSFLEALMLSEGLADVFAALVEQRVRGWTDWKLGSGIFPAGGTRDMAEPSASQPPQPDTYFGNDYVGLPIPGAAHHNSTVVSHWFYRLAVGGIGTNDNFDDFDVAGVGSEAAARVAFTTLTQMLPSSADLQLARDASLFAAELLYGAQSAVLASTIDAWHAVGVGQPYQNNLLYLPADGALDVDPWPSQLAWEGLPGEADWQVEISESPAFELVVITRTSAKASDIAGTTVVELAPRERPSLRPATTYHWRVRGYDADAGRWLGWRVPVSFTTDEKVPEGLQPTDLEDLHPWDLKLEWAAVPGAGSYQIQVSHDGDYDAPLVELESVTGTETIVDVLVDRPHEWRVRAVGPQVDVPENAGAWSYGGFVTHLPRVTLVTPLDDQPEYPWPTVLTWEDVVGASEYRLDLAQNDGVFDPDGADFVASIPHRRGVAIYQYPINVQPHWSHEHVTHWWQVRVVGPGPWFEEGGLPLEDGSWQVDGDPTLPDRVLPVFALADMPCFDYGQAMHFEWHPVPEATDYILSAELLEAPDLQPGSFSLEHGAQVFSQTYPGTELSVQIADVDGVTGAMVGPHHLGYWWHVRAIGPQGILGLESTFGTPYLIESTEPRPLTPDGKEFGYNDDVVLGWETDHAPGGEFKLRLYSGAGCPASGFDSDSWIQGASPGTSEALVTGTDPGRWYSFRVTPQLHITTSQCTEGAWSACHSFRRRRASCGNGEKEGAEECDDGNTTSGDGCSAACRVDLPCGTQVASGADLDETFQIDLGGHEGTFTFAWDNVVVPDAMTVRYAGQTVVGTGCAGGQGVALVTIDGQDDFVTVEVDANCDDQPADTVWQFVVDCVGDAQADAGAE